MRLEVLYRSGRFLLITLLALARLVGQAPLAAEQKANVEYSIAYTGRLFGYARTPENQAKEDQTCAVYPNDRLSKFTRAMLRLTQADTTRMLVGMGNNFAPNLEARTFEAQPVQAQGSELPKYFRESKERYEWNGAKWISPDGESHSAIPMDNVGCYFVQAKYMAIVPGKHDFWFGPERVQLLARLLAKGEIGKGEAFQPVQMLAANIAILTNFADPTPPLPDHLKNLKYEVNKDAILPSTVLPYLRQFRIKNARQYWWTGRQKTIEELTGYKVCRSSGCQVKPPSTSGRELKLIQDVIGAEAPGTSITVHETLSVGNAWICPARSVSDPGDLELPTSGHCTQLVEAETACLKPSTDRLRSLCNSHNLDLASSFDFTKPTADVTYIYSEGANVPRNFLEPGKSYGLCTEIHKPQHKNFSCAPFSVHLLFLQDTGRTEEGITVPGDWAYHANDAKGPAVTVFGVVDPSLGQHIGMLNSSWYNRDHKLDTALEFVPPDQALAQLLQKCAEAPACANSRKVLLAQMPHPSAAQLIGSFPSVFDLTISEADYEHDTGQETQTRVIGVGEPAGRRTGFLVTPRGVFEAARPPSMREHLEPHLSVAKLSGRSSEGSAKWVLDHSIEVLEAPPPPAAPSILQTPPIGDVSQYQVRERTAQQQRLRVFFDYGRRQDQRDGLKRLSEVASATTLALGQQLPRPDSQAPQSNVKLLQDLALLVLQRHFASDIALLQKRDLFDAEKIGNESVSRQSLQDVLNTIFWKGDMVVRTHVTGAAIKKILKRSKELDAMDQDGLSTELEKNRGLITVGVVPNPLEKDSYYVNGALLDDTGLYSVAASDFLGIGDTGYPDVKDATLPQRMKDFKGNQTTISSLVCREVAIAGFHIKRDDPALDSYCERPVRGEVYLDRSNEKSFDSSAGYTTMRHYQDGLQLWKRPGPPVRGGDANGVVQQRPYWSLKLENADVGYTAYLIQDPIASKQKFAGSPVPQVTASETNTFQEDYRIRFAEDYSHLDWFVLSESKYQRQWKRDSKAPHSYSTTQPLDVLALESGFDPRVYPTTRPSGLRLILSVRYEQPLLPLDQTTLSPPATAPPAVKPITVETAQMRTVFGKIGFRQDFVDTWYEGGFRYGRAFDLLDHYLLNGINCYPTAEGFLTTVQAVSGTPDPCLSHLVSTPSSSDVQLVLRNAWQSGLFFNFNLKLPIYSKKKIFFTLSNQGSLFFERADDRSVDTRYQDVLTPALQLPLFGKFSLQPKVDFFLYENKINHWHFRSMAPALSLQYQFNWRQGEAWKPALIYGSTLSSPK